MNLYKVEWFSQDINDRALRTGWVIADSPQDALDRAEDEAFGVDVAPEDDPINEHNAQPPQIQDAKMVEHMYNLLQKDREDALEELDRIDVILMGLEELR